MRRALDTLIWVVVIAAISAVFYTMSPTLGDGVEVPKPPQRRADRPRHPAFSTAKSSLPEIIKAEELRPSSRPIDLD